MKRVKFYLFTAGYTTAKGNQVIKGGPKTTQKLPATWGLIHHPDKGWILFDTGYAMRSLTSAEGLFAKIFARLLPIFVEPEEEVVAQVRKLGIDPASIKHIILSHFHGDHMAGLMDFPGATVFCSVDAWESVKRLSGLRAIGKAYHPKLLPADFESHAVFIDAQQAQNQDPHLGPLVDLFGDGSIQLCWLEGHAKGQLGAILNTVQGTVFLVADAAWVREHYETEARPISAVQLVFESWKEYLETLKKLRAYRKANPEVLMIPCHCQNTLEEVTAKQGAVTVS